MCSTFTLNVVYVAAMSAVTPSARAHTYTDTQGDKRTGEEEQDERVPRRTVVFVKRLAVVDAADKVRKVELDDANGRLQEKEDVRDEPEDRVRRLEVRAYV
jgi:hypothetical protein